MKLPLASRSSSPTPIERSRRGSENHEDATRGAGDLDAGDRDAGKSVICGGSVCSPRLTPACCTTAGTGERGNKLEVAGREANLCGTDLGKYAPALVGICLQLNQPGVLDTSCPDVPSPTPGQATMKGCCTDQGYCGAMEAALPLGCEYSGKRGKGCGKNADAGTDGGRTDAGP